MKFAADHYRTITRSPWFTLSLFLGLTVLFTGTCQGQLANTTAVQQIRNLSPEQALTGQSVRLRGVVTALSGWKSSFFLQDSSAGISVDHFGDDTEAKTGQLVEVVGTTGPGRFAPIVKATAIHILGVGTMPQAKRVSASILASGIFDSQRIRLTGVVHTAAVKTVWGKDVLVLELELDGGSRLSAYIRHFNGADWQHLPAAVVSLQGVCGTIFNDHRQYLGSRIFVPSIGDVTVLKAGFSDLFDKPAQPLNSIARFSTRGNTYLPIRVHGTVTYWQGNRVYLQDSTGGLLINTSQKNAFPTGSLVDAVGYAREGEYTPSLEDATLRLASYTSMPVVPHTSGASQLIEGREGFLSSPDDARLVRLTGVLKEEIPGVEERVLILEDADKVFTARLGNETTLDPLPAIGSAIQITGVCVTRVDSTHEPNGFKILLRSKSDISIIRKAPWWNAEHAKMVVATMAFVIVLLLALLTVFRRESTLKQLSLQDPLTEVYNRRGFVALAEQQRRLALRNKESMLLFYVDVNRFKQINDTLGHRQGDEALREVARILRECFRASDIIGRLGGDEFAVIACDSNAQAAEQLENRLMLFVQQSNRSSGALYQLSLSVGTLLCDETLHDKGIDDLLARADILMYEHKLGRDYECHSGVELEVITA